MDIIVFYVEVANLFEIIHRQKKYTYTFQVLLHLCKSWQQLVSFWNDGLHSTRIIHCSKSKIMTIFSTFDIEYIWHFSKILQKPKNRKMFEWFFEKFVRFVRSNFFKILVRVDGIDLVRKLSKSEPSLRLFGHLKIFSNFSIFVRFWRIPENFKQIYSIFWLMAFPSTLNN